MNFSTFHERRNTEGRTFKYFNTMYAVALAAIGIVVIISQTIIQNQVRYLETQVLTSQRISPVRLQLNFIQKTALNHEQPAQYIKYILESVFPELDSLFASSKKEAVSFSDDKLLSSFAVLRLEYEVFKKKIRFEKGNELALLTEFNAKYNTFLDELQHVINQNLESLRTIELSSITIVLVTIVLEILFIFNPVARKIKKVIHSVVDSEARAQRLAQKMNELNVSLQKSNKDIHDINAALDKGTILIKTDKEGKIIYANDRYCNVTRYAFEELLNRPLFFNNQGGDESIIYEHIRNNEKSNTIWQGEIYDHAKDGSSFWLDVTLYPIVSMDGNLYQYLVISSDITKRKRAEKQLQLIQERRFTQKMNEQKVRSYSVILGQEQERKRMAREIHDGVGQMLTALKFGSEAVSPADEKQKGQMSAIKDLLRKIIREIRRISSDLLPTVLSDFGLEAAIKDMISIINTSSESINIVLDSSLEVAEPLDKTIEISLYRIVQEAVNNALKYASATEVVIKLNNDAEFINLTITDDGRGFDPEAEIKKNINKETGNGLTSMRERAELVKGKFSITSKIGSGTTVFVEAPLDSDSYEQD